MAVGGRPVIRASRPRQSVRTSVETPNQCPSTSTLARYRASTRSLTMRPLGRASATGPGVERLTISGPMTMAMARRLLPFIDRHHASVAIHNQVVGNPAGAIDTGRLREVLALSPYFMVALDIGDVTASNGDAVADLRRYEARVSHVLVKDRLRNGGASQPFGEGDSPIAHVLEVLEKSARPIPAVVEYDYVGLRAPEEEVAASMAYLSRVTKSMD